MEGRTEGRKEELKNGWKRKENLPQTRHIRCSDKESESVASVCFSRTRWALRTTKWMPTGVTPSATALHVTDILSANESRQVCNVQNSDDYLQQEVKESAQKYRDTVLLQTPVPRVPSMLEQKPLAHAVSPPVLQSYGIHSLLMSVIFSPPMPLKLQYELTCTMCRCGVWGIQHYDCMIIIFEVLMDTFLLIFVCSPLSVRYSTMKITIVVIIIP